MSKKFTKKELARANRVVGGGAICGSEVANGTIPVVNSEPLIVIDGVKCSKKNAKGRIRIR